MDKYPRTNHGIYITCQDKSIQRLKVVDELLKLFTSSGFNYLGSDNPSIGGTGDTLIRVMYYNEIDQDFTKDLAKALNDVIKVEIKVLKWGMVIPYRNKDFYNSGSVEICIYGDPIFRPDGTIILK